MNSNKISLYLILGRRKYQKKKKKTYSLNLNLEDSKKGIETKNRNDRRVTNLLLSFLNNLYPSSVKDSDKVSIVLFRV